MAIPIIAIVGRSNVGKSTLFNRLAGRRIAVVSDVPGTTRDRVSGDASWGDRRFILVDTGGLEPVSEDTLLRYVRVQAERALADADAVILVVDTVEGVTPADVDAADLVRRSAKPTVLAANKADNLERERTAAEFYALGLGDPVPVSAYHGMGMADLMEALLDRFPFEPEPEEDAGAIRIAIAGRPNVGKSALFNAISGEERAIVHPVAGTTRDAVDIRGRYADRDLLFIDTAGLRRRGRADAGIEKYSILRTLQAIERAHVVLLVMDAAEFVTAQDTHVAGFVSDAARAVVIVVNKWDLAPALELTAEEATARIRERFQFLYEAPIRLTSALCHEGIEEVLESVIRVYEEYTKLVPSRDLRRVILDAMAEHPAPSQGRLRVRLNRASQVSTGPPTIHLHMDHARLVHFSYHRYLENRLRAAFGFDGSPLRLELKGN
ncbi:MAG: ribosome biogenesis GTPase Der [Chloroflexi bacterium]|nr:ribosome biogenesis GTPase Der [Chloroflexota bacterium]